MRVAAHGLGQAEQLEPALGAGRVGATRVVVEGPAQQRDVQGALALLACQGEAARGVGVVPGGEPTAALGHGVLMQLPLAGGQGPAGLDLAHGALDAVVDGAGQLSHVLGHVLVIPDRLVAGEHALTGAADDHGVHVRADPDDRPVIGVAEQAPLALEAGAQRLGVPSLAGLRRRDRVQGLAVAAAGGAAKAEHAEGDHGRDLLCHGLGGDVADLAEDTQVLVGPTILREQPPGRSAQRELADAAGGGALDQRSVEHTEHRGGVGQGQRAGPELRQQVQARHRQHRAGVQLDGADVGGLDDPGAILGSGRAPLDQPRLAPHVGAAQHARLTLGPDPGKRSERVQLRLDALGVQLTSHHCQPPAEQPVPRSGIYIGRGRVTITANYKDRAKGSPASRPIIQEIQILSEGRRAGRGGPAPSVRRGRRLPQLSWWIWERTSINKARPSLWSGATFISFSRWFQARSSSPSRTSTRANR